jgi:hypothetical protein
MMPLTQKPNDEENKKIEFLVPPSGDSPPTAPLGGDINICK